VKTLIKIVLALAVVGGVAYFAYEGFRGSARAFDAPQKATVHVRGFEGATWAARNFHPDQSWSATAFEVAGAGSEVALELLDRDTPFLSIPLFSKGQGGTAVVAFGYRVVDLATYLERTDVSDEERIALTKLPEAQQAATEKVLYRVVASVTPSSGAAVRTVKEGPVPAAHAPTDSRSGICSAKLAFPVSPGYVAFPTGAGVRPPAGSVLPGWPSQAACGVRASDLALPPHLLAVVMQA
jgi:hypothetical protein